MTDAALAPSRPRPGARQRTTTGWVTPSRLIGLAIGALFAGPAAFVVWRTIRLGGDLGDVLSEVPAPLWRTIQLSVLVSTSTAVLGTGLAWLTTRTDLPGRRLWRIALVLPLVLPSFVGAAAFIAGLAPGGVLYDALTAVGITPPSRFRGLGASWLVLTAFTYPYVYLPVAARLLRLRSSLEESGRMLGLSSTATFFKVTLPQLRTAVFGGALLVFLYTLSEFGAVQLLGYDTLTRVIFASRQTNRALSFAAASVVLVLALGVVALERSQRGVSRPDDRASMLTRHPTHLRWGTVPALAACTLVLSVGLLVPVASLATWAQRGLADGRVGFGELVQPAMSTAIVAIAAAIAATVIVLPIALATTRRPHRSSDIAAVSVVVGFAIPGLVLALALAVLTLNTPALDRLYQTTALLILAYVIHFGSQALASSESAARSVPNSLRESSRLLEPNPVRRFLTIDFPLMRPGLVAGAGLVLLSTVKELPATLLLSPPDFSTLSTEIWSAYEEGFYAAAGLASLVLIGVSAVLTWVLVLRGSDVVRK
ncbi:ABC transporter permease [Ilumatobacter sp.]|jgi:iron(III) transport system permease protein|uniref:ABC transporter permease n=1 Tax=Ilumatobacter sp. TaxID=1967498 RepID=UPI002A2745C2|nr:iron ABC transporter permease [Ilumatobacter sp.]